MKPVLMKLLEILKYQLTNTRHGGGVAMYTATHDITCMRYLCRTYSK